jgi:Asp-tRNA(Asn)/Glu-tRNA(Gln) amidotransferase A subunit family amidase
VADLELCYAPARRLAALVREGAVSPVELVANAIDRIAEVNPTINAFCAVFAARALGEAKAAERAARQGRALPPLHGVPIAIKDLTPSRGDPTTLGSRLFKDRVTDEDAVVVERLRRAGAIIVGKTNTPEFGYSGFTRNELWGETRNPWNPRHTPGGSSGGSAAAVAAGCVALAEGSDGGGSIREPAACCGVVGLKPSFGRIPFDLLPTQFSTVFHLGPLARTVADAALFLAVTNGPDDRDIASLSPRLELPVPPLADVTGLRLALNVDFGFFYVDPEVAANLRSAAAALAERGAVVEDVDLRFDREAIRASEADLGALAALIQGEHLHEHRDLLTPRAAAIIEDGRRYGGTAVKAFEIARTNVWRALAPVLARHDALLCPTQAGPAPRNDQSEAAFDRVDEAGRYHGHFMSQYFNFASQAPALSVPSGFTASGLPTAVQIVGRRYDDPMVLRIGAALEAARPWSARRPPL